MSDTETRPTPKAIADAALEAAHCGMWVDGADLIHNLGEHGYRIVHPDDVPTGDGTDWPADLDPRWNLDRASYGWNACRAHIFGGDDE